MGDERRAEQIGKSGASELGGTLGCTTEATTAAAATIVPAPVPRFIEPFLASSDDHAKITVGATNNCVATPSKMPLPIYSTGWLANHWR